AGQVLGQGAVPAASLEVADIFRRFGPAYRQAHAEGLARAQRRVMSAIELCRSAALGGHVERCDQCGHQRISYNSCRNRHCPKCEGPAREAWLSARIDETPPVPYAHLVFTLPPPIRTPALPNNRPIYDILFPPSAPTPTHT